MGLSTGHLLLLIFAALFIFGAGRLPQVMSDFARGIRAFKKGLSEEEDPSSHAVLPPKDHPPSH